MAHRTRTTRTIQPGLAGLPRIRRNRASLCASTALQAAAFVVLAGPAGAQVAANVRPAGGQVSSGQATIGGNAATTTINQASQNAVINWQTYNLGSGQTVQYIQPNSASFALNRVITPQPSQIAGRIVANGRIAIVNQSGVVFLGGSTVDTAGLVVSAAGISDQDFMAGRLVFGVPARPGAAVSNAGNITIRQAGLAALVAPQVANSGVITAQLGRVILGGATTHTLDMYGDGLVALNVTGQVTTVDVAGHAVPALVTNTGTILAPGGTVVLTAQAADGVVSTAVSAGGVISAPTLGAQTGRVLVSGIGGDVEVEGTVSASGVGTGGAGGQIEVNGNRGVTLAAGALADASGDAGGGLVALGTTAAHARSSLAPATLTAARATVATGATIRANGGLRGHGGSIAIASSGHTSVSGSISAAGGAVAGDGGTVSVDGATNTVNAAISTLAPNGTVGEAILNNLLGTAYIGNSLPLLNNLCIVGSCYSLAGITGYSKVVNAHGNVDFIYNSSASDLLHDTTYTLSVQTTGAGHDINIDAGVNIDVKQINLQSSGGIFLDTSNYTLFNLPLVFKAPTSAATLTAQTSIDLAAIGAISAGAGFGGVTGALVTPMLAITQAGTVTLDSTDNLVTALAGASPVGGNFTFTDGRGLSVTAPISATGDVFISVNGATSDLVSSAAIGGADIYLQSGGGMSLGGALTARTGSAAGTIGLAALGGDLALTGAVTAGTLAATTSGAFSANNASNAIGTIGTSATDVAATGISAGGDVTLLDATSLEVQASVQAGTLGVAGSENLALTAGKSGGAPLTLTVDAGATIGSDGGTIALQADRFALVGTSDAHGGLLAIDLFDQGTLQLGAGAVGSTDNFGGHGLGTVLAGTLALGSITGTTTGHTSSLLLDASLPASFTPLAGTLGVFSTGIIRQDTAIGLSALALYGTAGGNIDLAGAANAIGEIVSIPTGGTALGLTSTGGTLTLVDGQALTLQSTTVTATAVSISAGGAGLTQTGGLLEATLGTLSVTALNFSQAQATARALDAASVSGGLGQTGSGLFGSSVTVGGGVTQSASTVSGGSVTIGGSVDQTQGSLIQATVGAVQIGAGGGAATLVQGASSDTISAATNVVIRLTGDLSQDASSLITSGGTVGIVSTEGTLSIGGTLSAGLVSLQAMAGDISQALAGASQTGTILAGTLAALAGSPGSADAVLYNVLLDTASSATSGNRITTLGGIVSAGTTLSGATGTFSLSDGAGLTIAHGALLAASNAAAGAATPGLVALQVDGGLTVAGLVQAGTQAATGAFAGDTLLHATLGSITETLGGGIETGRLAAEASGSIDLSTGSTLTPGFVSGNQIAQIATLTASFGTPQTIAGLSAAGTINLVDGQDLAVVAPVIVSEVPGAAPLISLDLRSGLLTPDVVLPTSPTLTVGAGGMIALGTLATGGTPVGALVRLIADQFDFAATGGTAVSAAEGTVTLDLAFGQFADVISPGTFTVASGAGATIQPGSVAEISTYGLDSSGKAIWGTLALGSQTGSAASSNTASLLITSVLDLTQANHVARDLGLFSTGDITSDAGLILDGALVGGTLYGSAGSTNGHGFASITGANTITTLAAFSTLGAQTAGAVTTGFDLTDQISLFVGGPVNGVFANGGSRPVSFNGGVAITVNNDGNTLTVGDGASINGNDVTLTTTGVSGAATAIDLAAGSTITAWGAPPTTGALGGTLDVTASQGDIALDGFAQTGIEAGLLPNMLGKTDLRADLGNILEANTGTIVTGTLAARAGAFEGTGLYSVLLDSTPVAGVSSNRIGTLASLDAFGSGATDIFSVIDGTGLTIALGAVVEAGNTAGSAGHSGTLSLTVATSQAGDLTIDGTLQAGILATLAPGVQQYAGSITLDDAAAVPGTDSITEAASGAVHAYSLNANALAGEVLLADPGGTSQPLNVVEHVVGSNEALGRFDLALSAKLPGGTLPMQNVFVDAGAAIRASAIDIQVAHGNLNLEIAAGLPGAVIAGGSTVSLAADLGVLQFGGAITGNEVFLTAGAEVAQFAGSSITGLPLSLAGTVEAPSIIITAGTLNAAAGFANDIILADGHTVTLNGIALGGTVSALATGGLGSVSLFTPAGDISQAAPGDATSGTPTTSPPSATGTVLAGSVAFQAGAVTTQPSAAGGLLSNVWLTQGANQIGTLTGIGGLSGAAGAVSVTDATNLALAQDVTLSADGPVTLALATSTLTQLASGTLASGGAVTLDAALVVQAGLGLIQATTGDIVAAGGVDQAGGSAIEAASGNFAVAGSLAQNASTASAARSLSVGASLVQAASVAQAGGLASLLGGGSLTQSFGSTLTGGGGVDLKLAGGMSQDATSLVSTTGGSIGITAAAGDIAFGGTIQAGAPGSVVVLDAQAGSIASPTGTLVAGILAARAAGSIVLDGANAIGTIGPATAFGDGLAGLSAGAALSLRDGVALALNGASVSGAGIDIADTASLAVQGGSMVAGAGNVSLESAGFTQDGGSTIAGQTGVSLASSGAVVQQGGSSIASAAGLVRLTQAASFLQGGASTIDGQVGVVLASSGAVVQQDSASVIRSGGAFSTLQIETPATMSFSGTLAAPRILLGDVTAPQTISWAGGTIETESQLGGKDPAQPISPQAGGQQGLFAEAGSFSQTGATHVIGLPGAAAQTIQLTLSGPGGAIAFDPSPGNAYGLIAPQAQLLLDLGASGTASGNIAVAGLTIYYTGASGAGAGGTKFLTGSVDGRTGTAAAASAFIHPGESSNYQLNGCPIQSFNCVLLSPVLVPLGSPVRDLEVSVAHRRGDDDDLILPNVAEQDY